jgi:hypothetical protein
MELKVIHYLYAFNLSLTENVKHLWNSVYLLPVFFKWIAD